MKTTTVVFAILMSLAVLAGCAPRGEIALQGANPDAYEATRGGHAPGGHAPGGFGGK